MFQIIKTLSHFIALFLTGLILVLGLKTAAFGFLDTLATTQAPTQLLQQGIELYQAGKYTSVISLFQQALQQTTQSQDRAAILSNLAQVYRQIGKLDAAIPLWEQAIEIYRSHNDAESHRHLAQVLTEQAQAYSYIGQNERAFTLLDESLSIIKKYPDRTIELILQGALGDIYRRVGDYEKALKATQKSVEIAKSLNNPEYLTMALINLGNVYVSQAERLRNQFSWAKKLEINKFVESLQSKADLNIANALKTYAQSVNESEQIGGLPEVRSLLRLNSLLVSEKNIRTSETERIANNSNRLLELLAVIPDSRDKAYALTNLAQQQLKMQSIQTENALSKTQIQPIVEILEQAITVTRNVDDIRAESFALGELGYVYELAQEYSKAMELTRQAELAAQKVNAADSLYLWYWQAGRILNTTGEKKQALATYWQTYRILQTIRGDIVTASKEIQFNFRDEVEPVYRELIGLLLEYSIQTNNELKEQIVPTLLAKQAIDVLETLKLAELQNIVGKECLQITQNNSYNNANNTNLKSAIIYSVILKDYTAMIMQLPNQPLKVYPISIGERELETEIDKLRFLLKDQTTDDYLEQSKKIYNLLIAPLETDLVTAKPETLVFIQDGGLWKVPMSAIYDGKQFLIEKYPIAIAPSINLTNYNHTRPSNLQALIMGLSLGSPHFPPLPNVKKEVKRVQQILGGTTLVDKDFTLDNFINKLETESYPIVHIATHATVGIDNDSTFLVGFNQNIHISDIDLAMRTSKTPVELLVMSACQTVLGGFASVAVRAGVNSVLATLWHINDAATVPLIEEFYTQLRQPNITKAEALRRAQIKLLNNPSTSHPALWSPFILIGNWL